MTKLVSIVTPCYNEVDNIKELVDRIRIAMSALPYDYEHIFIDNSSSDGTIDVIKDLAKTDLRIKLIVNARNFGHIRSPFHGLLQSSGDVCVYIASDLQDPPELIPEFLIKWAEGFRIVLAVKPQSDEASFVFALRRLYYKVVGTLSDVPLVENATGVGAFDRSVIDILRSVNDPYPYFRGLLCEIGFPIATVAFRQPRRRFGVTKNNFYSLYDIGILGVTNHTKVPLRLITLGGFFLSLLSLIIAVFFLIAKLIFWNSFQLGTAPLLIGLFFFGAVQTFSIGILGEYIGSIHTHVRKLPLVIESERVNF